MVFTEDLGNCSLTVRTTSASNAGPADGFVRRTFNETPGDGIPVPSCFCRLSPFVTLFRYSPCPSLSFFLSPSYFSPFCGRPFVDPAAHTIRSYSSSLSLCIHATARVTVNGHVRYHDTGFTRDFARRFVSRPSLGIGVFWPVVAFFSCRAALPVHFPVFRARCLIMVMQASREEHRATRVKRRGIRPIWPINVVTIDVPPHETPLVARRKPLAGSSLN